MVVCTVFTPLTQSGRSPWRGGGAMGGEPARAYKDNSTPLVLASTALALRNTTRLAGDTAAQHVSAKQDPYKPASPIRRLPTSQQRCPSGILAAPRDPPVSARTASLCSRASRQPIHVYRVPAWPPDRCVRAMHCGDEDKGGGRREEEGGRRRRWRGIRTAGHTVQASRAGYELSMETFRPTPVKNGVIPIARGRWMSGSRDGRGRKNGATYDIG